MYWRSALAVRCFPWFWTVSETSIYWVAVMPKYDCDNSTMTVTNRFGQGKWQSLQQSLWRWQFWVSASTNVGRAIWRPFPTTKPCHPEGTAESKVGWWHWHLLNLYMFVGGCTIEDIFGPVNLDILMLIYAGSLACCMFRRPFWGVFRVFPKAPWCGKKVNLPS